MKPLEELLYATVTVQPMTNETQVGSCYYNCENIAHKILYNRVYHPLPKSPTKLTAKSVDDLIEQEYCMVSVNLHGLTDSPFVLSHNLIMSCVHCQMEIRIGGSLSQQDLFLLHSFIFCCGIQH